MLRVEVYLEDEEDTVSFPEAEYVSLFTDETYGPPALVAPSANRNEARAGAEELVVYINTAKVPMFTIERIS